MFKSRSVYTPFSEKKENFSLKIKCLFYTPTLHTTSTPPLLCTIFHFISHSVVQIKHTHHLLFVWCASLYYFGSSAQFCQRSSYSLSCANERQLEKMYLFAGVHLRQHYVLLFAFSSAHNVLCFLQVVISVF